MNTIINHLFFNKYNSLNNKILKIDEKIEKLSNIKSENEVNIIKKNDKIYLLKEQNKSLKNYNEELNLEISQLKRIKDNLIFNFHL